jgi:hypothetical protein
MTIPSASPINPLNVVISSFFHLPSCSSWSHNGKKLSNILSYWSYSSITQYSELLLLLVNHSIFWVIDLTHQSLNISSYCIYSLITQYSELLLLLVIHSIFWVIAPTRQSLNILSYWSYSSITQYSDLLILLVQGVRAITQIIEWLMSKINNSEYWVINE